MLRERTDIDVAYSYLAHIYESLGKPDEAIEILNLGRQYLPSSYEVFISLVNAYLNSGRYDEVISTIKEGDLYQMEHDPEIWNWLGIAYTKKENFHEAIKVYEMALSLHSRYPVIYNNLAAVYYFLFSRSRDRNYYQEAVDNYKKAIELDPLHASSYNGLGTIYWQVGLFQEAIDCWEKAVSLQPDFDLALYNLGRAYLEKGDKVRALEKLTRYKEKNYQFLSREEREKLDGLIQKCKKNP